MRVFRIAPSPTGRLHFGHTKPYLMNYALARANQGKFILRIEDTDQKRNQMETVKAIIEDLKWLGVDYDEGPNGDKPNEYFQSQRLEIYNKFINELLQKGLAYKAYETPEERQKQIEEQRKKGKLPVYSGDHANLTKEEQLAFENQGRKPVIRLKIPKNEIVEFEDAVYGKIKTSTNVIGDIVIQKSDGYPMYNFAVVVDDHTMEVTDVVRGYAHVSNTPKQILIYNALNWIPPTFAHFSDILNENEPGKLSKRKGAKSISQYKAEGYLPDAIFNYVTVISCSFSFASKDEEIMSREEIYSKISYKKLIKTNAKFNAQKLDWMNGQHIRKLSEDSYIEKAINWLENDAKELKSFDDNFDTTIIDLLLSDKEKLTEGLKLIHPRIVRFKDIIDQLKFLFIPPVKANIDISSANHHILEFEEMAKILYNILYQSSTQTHSEWEASVRSAAEEKGWKHGDVFMVLRLLIVGERYSPPLYEAMQIIGRDEYLNRMKTYNDN